jgi:ATP-binding cassette subfamily B (MDR/TAP) protein 1
VEKYGLEGQFAKATPAGVEKLLTIESGEVLTSQPYRSLVGELLYLSVCTRPDIAFAVGMLSKFLDKAGEMHWAAAIRVLLYLKGTMTYGLPLGGKGNNSSLISYVVTLSTTESEFIALTDVARELLWMQPIYVFLGSDKIQECTIIYEDNLPVINLALNQQTKGRTKHLNVKVKFIAQMLEQKIFKIEKVKSAENIADQMTKAQSKVLFLKHRSFYMVERQSLNG